MARVNWSVNIESAFRAVTRRRAPEAAAEAAVYEAQAVRFDVRFLTTTRGRGDPVGVDLRPARPETLGSVMPCACRCPDYRHLSLRKLYDHDHRNCAPARQSFWSISSFIRDNLYNCDV
jgi:hypothetical protein